MVLALVLAPPTSSSASHLARTLTALALITACAPQPPASVSASDEAVRPSEAAAVAEPAPADPPASTDAVEGLVVHEWGTFTARLEGGQARTWTAADRVEPLPSFVFESWMTNAKQEARGTIRMETPVLYFYSAIPRRLAVGVEFPGGFLTEWYPSARHEDTTEQASLAWPQVELEPGPDPAYVIDGASHYYAARETEATPLIVRGPEGSEPAHEKFLFYRGVGSFELSLAAEAKPEPKPKTVELRPSRPIAAVFVVRREGEAIGLTTVGAIDSPRTVDVPALDHDVYDDIYEIDDTIHDALVDAGLYDAEAEAMLDTWGELWFEPGLRVFYLVPSDRADELLPLTIEPAPDEVVRVFVGRLDLR